MMNKHRLAAILTALAATTLLATGCGSDVECGKGTVEKDGKCIAKAGGEGGSTCGAGTVLTDGECVLDDSGCGPGTALGTDGTCIADGSGAECGAGTSLDTASGKCVADSDVACGPGTVDDNGTCKPDADNCAAGTTLDDGKCVIDPAACGEGTQLDANSGICAPAEEACAEGLGFTDGKCVPTDELCDTGTVFVEDTGLCLPEATCKKDDKIVDGICLSPAEALYNDPAATAGPELELADVGERVIFTGQITKPEEVDGELVNDVKKYTFEGEAGQYLKISLQALESVDLVFEVEGPEGINQTIYSRTSSVGIEVVPARYIYVPYKGQYTVSVQPALGWLLDLNADGGEGFEFAGTLEQLEAPEAEELTLDKVDAVSLEGNSRNLLSNLFKFDGSEATDLVTFTINDFGIDAASSIFVLSNDDTPAVLAEYNNLTKGASFSIPGNVDGFQVLVDNNLVGGQKVNYALSGLIDGVIEDITIDKDGEKIIDFSAGENTILKFSFDGTDGDKVDISIFDADDKQVGIDDVMIAGTPHFAFFAPGGDFTVKLKNLKNTDDIGGTLTVQVITPVDAGLVGADADTTHHVASHGVSEDVFVLVETVANQQLVFSYETGVDYDEVDIQELLNDLMMADIWSENGKKIAFEFIEGLPGLLLPEETISALTGEGQFFAIRMSHVPAGIIGVDGGAKVNMPYNRVGYDLEFTSEAIEVITDFETAVLTGSATESESEGTHHFYELRVDEPTYLNVLTKAMSGDGWMLTIIYEDGEMIYDVMNSADSQPPVSSQGKVSLYPGNAYILRVGGGQAPQFNDEFEYLISFDILGAPPAPPVEIAATGTNTSFADAQEVPTIPALISGSANEFEDGDDQYWKFTFPVETEVRFTGTILTGPDYGSMTFGLYSEDDLTLVEGELDYGWPFLFAGFETDSFTYVLEAGKTYYLYVGGDDDEETNQPDFTYEILMEEI